MTGAILKFVFDYNSAADFRFQWNFTQGSRGHV